MPSANVNKQQNKKRLGRGLGSLLSAGADSFAEQDSQGAQSSQSSQATQNNKAGQTLQQKKISQEKATQVAKEAIQAQGKAVAAPAPRPSQVDSVSSQVNEGEKVQKKSSEDSGLDSRLRVWNLAVEKIHPNKSQPRKDFSKDALEELSQSIQSQGVIQPITVRKKEKGYEIIAGERRWRASQMAGLKEVPCLIKDVTDQKMMELALIENLQREDLNPLEEAMGYEQLIEGYELTQAQLAEKVGKSRVAITNSLRILALPQEAKNLLRAGSLSLGHAKVLLSIQDPGIQKDLAKKCAARQWSVRTLEMEIKKIKDDTGAFQPDEKGQRLAGQLAGQLQKAIGTKVGIQYKKGKGRLEIHFYSDDELTGLYEKLKEALTPYHRN